MAALHATDRTQYGDYQTPTSMAQQVVAVLQRERPLPRSVLEPTCGEGSFLLAAAERFPKARIVGFDISRTHIQRARQRLRKHQVQLYVGDFFKLDWHRIIDDLPEPIWIIGNPPWVTNSALGTFSSPNLPRKHNYKRAVGLDAATGSSNFDISEAILLELLAALAKKQFSLALLCKFSVARKLIRSTARERPSLCGALYEIDARRVFGASVQAVLLRIDGQRPRGKNWPVYASLNARTSERRLGMWDGELFSDLQAARDTAHLAGESELEWRSGLKHDCSSVMELLSTENGYINARGKKVFLEPTYLFPLMKSSDLANARLRSDRRVLVTQRRLGDDTSLIEHTAPATWRYLREHRRLFSARKSRVYENQPAFSMFGIGRYSFARYKVAISALYKDFRFILLGPRNGKPTMVDDTCYFLPCHSLTQARILTRALNGERARRFLSARVFTDDKRPIKKQLLQSLSLSALLRAEGLEPSSVSSTIIDRVKSQCGASKH